MPRATRRAAVQAFVTAPIAAALAPAAEAAARKSKAHEGPKLSIEDQKAVDKARADIRGAIAKIDAMTIPIGTEPAFVFVPSGRKGR